MTPLQSVGIQAASYMTPKELKEFAELLRNLLQAKVDAAVKNNLKLLRNRANS